MEKFKKYKNEIFLLIILLFILACFWKIGLLNLEDIFSDGTFVIGFLSIPIATSRYMAEKEESNRISEKQNELEADKFYYETLNILNDFSDCSTMQIRIMQLSKIRNQGYKYISRDSVDDFNKILADTAVNILTQDIEFSENKDKRVVFELSDSPNADHRLKPRLLDTNRVVFDKLADRIRANEVYLDKIFIGGEDRKDAGLGLINGEVSKILSDKYNNRLFWMGHFSEDAYDRIDFDRGSDYVFYECVFEDFSDFEKLSNYSLIRPVFNFSDESKKDSFVSTWVAANVDGNKIFDPVARHIGKRIPLAADFDTDKDLIEAEYYLEDEKLSRKEIKDKFSNQYWVKISRNYNKENDGTYKSWYTISNQLKDIIEKSRKDVVFVIDSDDLNMYIKIDNANILRLFDKKKADFDEDLQSYSFYLNAYKMDDGSYDLEDSKDKDSLIKFKATRIEPLIKKN